MQIEGSKFEIGFWHPFGPHAGETAEQIIERKRIEIAQNGWTLWSFQYRKTLSLWYEEIEKIGPERVWVFCSEGKGASDPTSERKYCNHYIPVNESISRQVPLAVKVPHPMGQKSRGSAFIVKKILYPTVPQITTIEWWKAGSWQRTSLPTRPEYLIRQGYGQPMRSYRAILELEAPYLAEVGVE